MSARQARRPGLTCIFLAGLFSGFVVAQLSTWIRFDRVVWTWPVGLMLAIAVAALVLRDRIDGVIR